MCARFIDIIFDKSEAMEMQSDLRSEIDWQWRVLILRLKLDRRVMCTERREERRGEEKRRGLLRLDATNTNANGEINCAFLRNTSAQRTQQSGGSGRGRAMSEVPESEPPESRVRVLRNEEKRREEKRK